MDELEDEEANSQGRRYWQERSGAYEKFLSRLRPDRPEDVEAEKAGVLVEDQRGHAKDDSGNASGVVSGPASPIGDYAETEDRQYARGSREMGVEDDAEQHQGGES
jgi:hypothetical protein